MAQKRSNGGSNGSDATLRDVVAELRGLREDTNARSRETNNRLEALSVHVDEGFAKVNARLERVEERLDSIRDLAGEHYRSLEARVAKLEARGPEPR